jgi:hypothetical protein
MIEKYIRHLEAKSLGPDENRPPRINQFSVSIQREITRDLVVEASYVANRAVWLTTTGTTIGTLGMLSQISPAQFAQFGLYPYPGSGPAGYNYSFGTPGSCFPGNDCDRALLSQPLNGPAVKAKLASVGLAGWTPYAGFPATNSLQSLTARAASIRSKRIPGFIRPAGCGPEPSTEETASEPNSRNPRRWSTGWLVDHPS